MTLEETPRTHASAAPPTFGSTAPLQIKFPPRSRQPTSQPLLQLASASEDLRLAPPHESVLGLTSPQGNDIQVFEFQDPDFDDDFGPDAFQGDSHRGSNSYLTAATIAEQTNSAGSDVGSAPLRALSSAGSMVLQLCCHLYMHQTYLCLGLFQVQMLWRVLKPVRHRQHLSVLCFRMHRTCWVGRNRRKPVAGLHLLPLAENCRQHRWVPICCCCFVAFAMYRLSACDMRQSVDVSQSYTCAHIDNLGQTTNLTQ